MIAADPLASLLFEKGGYYYNRFQLIPSLVIYEGASTGRPTYWTGP